MEIIYMPHAGHLIVGSSCRFHLNTYVNGFIVSTVGEYWPDSEVRKITAECRGIEIQGRGDDYDRDYMKKIGFEKIGCDRLYETMVFPAQKSDNSCCPYRASSWSELEIEGYNKPEDAMAGHSRMVQKYQDSKKESK